MSRVVNNKGIKSTIIFYCSYVKISEKTSQEDGNKKWNKDLFRSKWKCINKSAQKSDKEEELAEQPTV